MAKFASHAVHDFRAAAVALAAAWLSAPPSTAMAWETVAVPMARASTLTVGGVPQHWNRLEAEAVLVTEFEGPRDVRIDVRGLLPAGTRDPVPYVLELLLDGRPHDCLRLSAKVDPRASLSDYAVAKRRKIDVRVPSGRHSVGLRLAAGNPNAILAHFRLVERPEE
ncbi:MAG: hypothetical protein HY716_17655 [Planctomycetes bacterium]|nr:hypothetical protein [Planctomycetota bacterium]